MRQKWWDGNIARDTIRKSPRRKGGQLPVFYLGKTLFTGLGEFAGIISESPRLPVLPSNHALTAAESRLALASYRLGESLNALLR